MKSQAALEYMILASFAIFVITAIFYFSFTFSSDSMVYSQARDAVDTIATTVDYVYALGPGSRTMIFVTIPDNVVSSSVSGNIILLKISTSSGNVDIISRTRANITGSIPTQSGYMQIYIRRIGGIVGVGI